MSKKGNAITPKSQSLWVYTRTLLVLLLMLGTQLTLFQSEVFARDSRADVRRSMSKPEFRGGIVFKHYCVLCHGERGDGQARAAKLHGIDTLVIGHNSDEYNEKIIREGGAAVEKSDLMPPWGYELTEEQIADVLAYIRGVSDPVKRGEAVFKTNCILCHGVNADGKGRAAVLYDPPPADLTKSDKNDEYKTLIITLGGAAMGRSPVMPVWGEQLTTQEISDVVAYLRTVLK